MLMHFSQCGIQHRVIPYVYYLLPSPILRSSTADLRRAKPVPDIPPPHKVPLNVTENVGPSPVKSYTNFYYTVKYSKTTHLVQVWLRRHRGVLLNRMERDEAPSNQNICCRMLPVSLGRPCFIHAWLLVYYVNDVSVHMHGHDKHIWIHFYMLMRSCQSKALVCTTGPRWGAGFIELVH